MQKVDVDSLKSFLNWSEQLRDAHEVGLFQIFETRESFVEILRQIKHFLGHLNDLFFL